MPSRVKQIQPWLSYCTEVFFTAYDPPTVLRPASALVPPVASSDPEAHSKVPAASLTVDPVARHTVGSKPSIPSPASTPTVGQPKVTTNAAQNPPSDKGFGGSPGPENDPASQGSSLPLPTHNAVGPNSDPKGNNNHQQNGNFQPSSDSDPPIESDSDQVFDPKSSNDSNGSLDDGTDPKLHSKSPQADNSHGYEQIVDPVSQGNDTEQTNEENSLTFLSEGQTKTLNNQVIEPLSHGISIAGTTLTRGAPPITVSGTPIHFGPSALVVGTSTVPFDPSNPNPDPLTTTIAGHVITAAPDAIAIAGTTITPGAPPITVSGTPTHFASPALLIIGTSTLPFAAPTQIITTIAGQLITAAPNALTIPGTTLSPGSPGVKVAGTLISLDTSRHQLIVGTKIIALDLASGKNPIVTNVGGRVITAFPDKIAIASTILTPGASGTVVDGTLLSLNTAGQMIVGSQTVALLPSGRSTRTKLGMGVLPSEGSADPFVTTINGQVITAFSDSIAIASTTLIPGAPALTINGTLVSLNTATQLVLGSTTIPLELDESAGSATAVKSFITSSPNPTPSMEKGNGSTADGRGNGNGTSTTVQVFQGRAVTLLEKWKLRTASWVVAMVVAMVVYIS